MGTTADKLNKVLETKEAIRTAINNKGGTLTETDTFASYPTAINNIQSGGTNEPITITQNGIYTAPEGIGYSPITVNVPQTAESGTVKNLLDVTKSCKQLFYDFKGASVDGLISYNDTSSVIDMNSMFQDCVNLTTIPQLNTSNVTNMNNLFSGCEKVTTIPQLNTSSATMMRFTFSYCSRLATIDITHMNITSASNSDAFASECYSLTKLIIRNMTTIPTLSSGAFTYCYHFTGKVNATYNPDGLKDGRIYVPDDKVEELKAATNWSVYADIIVGLSTLVE